MRLRSKATGETYTVKREYDDGSLLFSDGRIRKKETVEKYFEEVGNESSQGPGSPGPADVQGGTGADDERGLGTNSPDSGGEEEDGSGDAGPDAPDWRHPAGDGHTLLEDRE